MQLRKLIKMARWFAFGAMRRWRYLQFKEYRRIASGMHWSTEFNCKGILNCAELVVVGRRTYLNVAQEAKLILKRGAWIGDDCEISAIGQIKIGAFSSIQNRTTILGEVTIGAGCACGANLYISSSWHHFDDIPELPIRWQDLLASPSAGFSNNSSTVTVGDDCWIGINVVISPGVTVGRGCVIGANSVVTKDLPPYSVAAGTPARILRTRLDFIPQYSLQANRMEHVPYFYSGFMQWGNDVTRLEQVLDQEGLRAEDEFSIVLKVETHKPIRLTVKASMSGELKHGLQKNIVDLGDSILSFLAEPSANNILAFSWRPTSKHEMHISTLTLLAVNQNNDD